MSLTSIELDLFLCPEWNIGAPFISVYGDNESSLVYSFSSDFLMSHTPNEISCDSLSTVTISFQEVLSYHNWHILVPFTAQPDIEWVHVGEVRFLGTDVDPTLISSMFDFNYVVCTALAVWGNLYCNDYAPCVCKK